MELPLKLNQAMGLFSILNENLNWGCCLVLNRLRFSASLGG
jgi:hypothetical protein